MLRCRRGACAFAHYLNQYGKCVVVNVHVVNGYGASQHHLLVAGHFDFDKLSGRYLGQTVGMLKSEREIRLIVNLLSDNCEIGNVLSHN